MNDGTHGDRERAKRTHCTHTMANKVPVTGRSRVDISKERGYDVSEACFGGTVVALCLSCFQWNKKSLLGGAECEGVVAPDNMLQAERR